VPHLLQRPGLAREGGLRQEPQGEGPRQEPQRERPQQGHRPQLQGGGLLAAQGQRLALLLLLGARGQLLPLQEAQGLPPAWLAAQGLPQAPRAYPPGRRVQAGQTKGQLAAAGRGDGGRVWR
jgi:hypothetical protein